jgi:hypothetical protein
MTQKIVKQYKIGISGDKSLRIFFKIPFFLAIELRTSHLLRQALYHLSHAPSPFSVGYF